MATTTTRIDGNGAAPPAEAPELRRRAAARLDGVRTEYRRAREHLDRLDAQRSEVADLLLRQSGAIQVLTELLGEGEDPEPVEGVEGAG
jgi:hypothetical protein